MLCTKCLIGMKTKDSRPHHQKKSEGEYKVWIYRRHKCPKCGRILKTHESVIKTEDPPTSN